MNTLLIILLIIGVIIAIILIAAALTPSGYVVEKEIIINRPNQRVFEYIKYLKNQDNYNKWVMVDPNHKKEYRGTDGTPGFVYAWDSDNKQVGKGELEIKHITEGKRVDLDILFIKPFEGKAAAYLTTEPAGNANQTKVNWVFSGQRNFPMKIMHVVFNLTKMLGRDLNTSLTNLKAVLEAE